MEYDENEFRMRLEKEVERLQERAETLEGRDKQLFRDIAHALGLYVKKLDGAVDATRELEEMERQQAFASIIDILNEIDVELKELNEILGEGTNQFRFNLHEASCIIDRFFYNCQIAEDRIKSASQRGYVTRKQVDELNGQLNRAVRRIVAISRRSDALLKMLQEKYGADVAS